jgi:hypothetical protein
MLTLAAALIFALGLAHSLLGERYILVRLFRRPDLPKLFGGTAFTTATLRFAWHLTTLAWWGFAAILLHVEYGTLSTPRLLQVIAVTTFVSGLLPLFFTRGRHLSWIVFFTVAALLAIAATRA